MSKSTLAFLVFLVIALGALWLVKEREVLRGGPALAEYPLLPGLSSEHVSSIRVDHLERSFQVRFERDQAGRWFLTDPLAYPAQAGLVRSLLATLAGARGEPAPEADPAQVGLAPPRVVIECEQRVGGVPSTLRVELGGLDLDPARMYARVPGHPHGAGSEGAEVFRTTRVLANTLERFPDDYRERKATTLQAQDVISLRRSGVAYVASEGRRVDLAFDALLGPDGWKRSAPTVSLDPSAMGLLARAATELVIERFVDDSPQDLARWGLAPPTFTLELESLAASPVTLLFGHRAEDPDVPVGELAWYCQRRGYAHVWEVRTRDVELLTQPAELFYDQLVVRVLRADVARLELEGGGARRVLALDERRGWQVWEGGDEPSSTAPATPGNPAAIEEALALLERVQLAEHLPDEAFEPTDPPSGFTLVLANGARLGGALGRATRDPKSGAQGRQFLRDGDEVVALIDAEVLELVQRPLADFRSRKVHQLQESTLRVIELEAAGKTFAFVNDGDNRWSPRGQAIRAPDDFVQSLDGLLNLGALRWLTSVPAHTPELVVRLIPVQAEPRGFRFVRAEDGTRLYLGEDGQCAEIEGELIDRLLSLF